MGQQNATTVTELLQAVSDGDRAAHNRLWELVYDELRGMARGQIAAAGDGKLIQTTSLVNEAYVQLAGREVIAWQDRRHFFGTAARAMRQIRVDRARARDSKKRGGGRQPVPIDLERAAPDQDDPAELLALNEALNKLDDQDAELSELIHLRYFAGLTIDQTAKAMGKSPRWADKKWAFGRAWVRRLVMSAHDGS